MKKIKDETLMAFVDGELGIEESKQVELALGHDQQARSRVEEFRKTRAAIDQFADVLDEPVPDRLIETIRRHEHQSNVAAFPDRPRQGNWFLLAASLVIGVSLGAMGTKYFLAQSHDREVAATASGMDSLAASLNAAMEKASTAEAKLADISKALEVALVEKGALQKKYVAAKTNSMELPFPLSLVSRAMENGSKVSPDLRRIIVAELKTTDTALSTASDFSRLSAKSATATSAVNVESLNDLQPTKTPERNKSSTKASDVLTANINNILGEFSYAGKTCRLFEYAPRPSSKALILVACKKGAGLWGIVSKKSLP